MNPHRLQFIFGTRINHCFGIGTNESQSSASNDNRVATGGDKSPVVQGGSAAANEGAIAGSGGSTVAGGGSVAQSGADATVGLRINNETGQVTVGVPPEQVGRLLTNILHDQAGSSASTLSTVLGAFGPLAQSAQTQGDADRNKIVLYIAIAALAALGLIAYRK